MLSPTETITFTTGLILCAVGVATFIVSLLTRAKNDGVLANKVDNALRGIEEIKQTISEQRSWREVITKEISTHDEQIKTLFNKIEEIENNIIRLHP